MKLKFGINTLNNVTKLNKCESENQPIKGKNNRFKADTTDN